jgi:hypothetical protein
VVLFCVPFTVYVVWQIVLALHWGQSALVLGSKQFGIPFGGMAPYLLKTITLATHKEKVEAIELSFFALFAGAVLYSLRASIVRESMKLAWLLYGGAALCWTSFVWIEDWSIVRLLSEFYLFGVIVLLGTSSRIKYVVFAAALALWLYLFRDFITLR